MKRIGMLLSGFVLLIALSVPPQPAGAAANSIGVNPRRDFTINSGEKIQNTLFVNNIDREEPLTVKFELIDFKPQNETGTPSLMLKNKEQTRWSLKQYLSLPDQVEIPAGKSKDVPFTISIPKNVGAGSYYSAIRYTAVNPETGENLRLTSSAVTLMFVRVPGETRSSLTLQDFGAFVPNTELTDGAFNTFFGATKPQYLSFRLKNNGNVAEQPTGSILIKDIFGNEFQTIENANPQKKLVLIEQTRRVDVCMNEERKQIKNPETGADTEDIKCNYPDLKPGRYTAQLGLVYGDNGNAAQEVRAVSTFWYLPAWFIGVVVAGLALIAFLAWRVVRAIKNRGGHKYRGR